MKDPRFLPVEKREPVEDHDDEFDEFLEGDEDELYDIFPEDGKGKFSVKKLQLYIAS